MFFHEIEVSVYAKPLEPASFEIAIAPVEGPSRHS